MNRVATTTKMTNKELRLVYQYLTGVITRQELSEQLGRSRTNSYYYIGRATWYWVHIGVLQFKPIKRSTELGGIHKRKSVL